MPAERFMNDRARQVICIIGMAMVWPSIHNQLLYPVTFSFHKEGADGPFIYYLIYSAIMLIITAFLAFANREQITKRVFTQKGAIAAFGIIGAIGTAMLVLCDFSHDLSHWLMGIGVVFAAAYVPIYFMFWSSQLVYASEKRAGFDLALSYILFCLLTMLRLAFRLHSWPFAICYQLISVACAILVLTGPAKKRYALTKTSVSELPLYMMLPSILFIYAATMTRCLLNPLEASYDYPPTQRTLIYMISIAVALLIAFFYRPHSKMRRYANLPAFAVTVALLAVGMLLTGLEAFDGTGFGNMPAIAGINAMELFIWLVVLANAQLKHAGILRSAALYLIFVVGASHMTTVVFAMSVSAFDIDMQQLPVLAITIMLAAIVMIAVNSTMAALFYRVQKQGIPAFDPPLRPDESGELKARDDMRESALDAHPAEPVMTMPPCVKMVTEESALQRIKDTFHLSKREMDTLRLAAQNMSAKDIAENLFVAESTVNSHLKGIYRKCDVHSRKELIALVNRFKREEKVS